MTDQKRTTRSMLSRGLSILNCFHPGECELALSELARRADLPKPTAHRLIAELVDAGMLERGDRGLRLGFNLFILGIRVPRPRMIRELSRPCLERMRELTRQSVFLFVPNGLDPVMLDSLRASRGDESSSCTPAEGAAAAHAVAKLLRAYRTRLAPTVAGDIEQRRPRRTIREPSAEELARVAGQGFAVAHGQDAVAIAVPVLDTSGAMIAALAVTGTPEQIHPVRTASYLQAAGAGLIRAIRGAPGLVQVQ
ncbi:helix-turn-helix domain-containing protein [Actinomadura graeca]|uniref:Helix-turn-helix domain-containing protein n=1 Tax=Actinomadura graeca TaxID=2750812 RepID=A0ABX8R4F2_9ACTN|nr:helix-turn-helix domain-containing protein [Actinomadura graeca]QXJ25708.1 helix-turn-helix domain-containing protein [Actinomadura graeca]